MAKTIIRTLINLDDSEYFCNKSWTISYNMNTKSWISFHSYIPNFYIAENNFFYSGINGCCNDFNAIIGTIIDNPTTTSTTTGCRIDGDIIIPTTTTTSTLGTTSTTTSTTTVVPCPNIGDALYGGTIAYVFQDGDPGFIQGECHGLVMTVNDQTSGAAWGCQGTTLLGARGYLLGTGNQNTIDILAECSTVGIAAKICSDLVEGGYNDWFLPSLGEFAKVYLNILSAGILITVGNITLDGHYWTSSQNGNSANHAYIAIMNLGSTIDYKNNSNRVRAFRYF